jgi:hypothetical protein
MKAGGSMSDEVSNDDTKFQEVLNALGSIVDVTLNNDENKRTVGFLLIVTDSENTEGVVHYLTNMQRSLVLRLLKDQLTAQSSKEGNLT